MKELASELDSLTEGKITVEGKDGKFIDQDIILRTNMPFEVDKAGTTLLNFDSVADQLQKAYARFVEDKKIKAWYFWSSLWWQQRFWRMFFIPIWAVHLLLLTSHRS